MAKSITDEQWVYVVIQDPGGGEQYLGQYEEESRTSFIPVFLKKDDALMCMNLMKKDSRKKYEIQAVMYEDLAHHAAAGGFLLYVLNENSEVIEKIRP